MLKTDDHASCATRQSSSTSSSVFETSPSGLLLWKAAFDSLAARIAILDETALIIDVNDAWRRFAAVQGVDHDGVGRSYLDVCEALGEPVSEALGAGFEELLAGRREELSCEYSIDGPGDPLTFVLRGSRHAGRDRSVVVLSHQDVTARRGEQQHSRLQALLLDEVDAAVIATDPGRTILSWNAGATRLLGWTAEQAVGRRTDELMLTPDVVSAGDRALVTGEWDGEQVLRRADGSLLDAYTRARVIDDHLDGHSRVIVEVTLDVSERRRAARELMRTRDHLRAVTDSMGEGMFTLDRMGRVTYMNASAERQLGWSASELAGQIMHEVTHSRHADGSPYAVTDCPILRARRDGEVVHVEDDIFIQRDGSELPVSYTASPYSTPDGLEGCVVVFQDISDRKAEARRIRRELDKLEWVRRIRDALDHDGFELHAQPIIELATGQVVQRELLLRLRSGPSEQPICPSVFLPIAEEYGFIAEIDRWVIAEASKAAARGLGVELNVSAASISDPRLIGYIDEVVRRTGADPRRMIFEITETALIEDERAARRFVQALRGMGCGVALDDFGTGYGGFTYLKQLPIDCLKIDVEFVRDLAANEASRHVVEAIVKLAQGFGLQTVAEGVEDEMTLALLTEIGVDLAQGYHIGRPAPMVLDQETLR